MELDKNKNQLEKVRETSRAKMIEKIWGTPLNLKFIKAMEDTK